MGVMTTGASYDEKKRNGRIFHVDSRNAKAIQTLKDYKQFLTGNDLENISAALMGGRADPEKIFRIAGRKRQNNLQIRAAGLQMI